MIAIFAVVIPIILPPRSAPRNDAWPEALHALIEAVLAASVEEALGGACTRIDVSIEDGVVTVVDDGPGLPIATDASGPQCEVLTRLGAPARDPRAARRLGGTSLVVTTALSAWLEVEIQRDDRRYRQRFERALDELRALVPAVTISGQFSDS